MKRSFVVFALLCPLLTAASAAAEKPVVIITDEEAQQPDAPGRSRKFGSDDPADGPLIVFNHPTYGSEVEKPVTIDISFRENLAPVDISTLQVTYLKLINIDITDRVREYATSAGIKIRNAAFPSGTHKVRFSLKDREQRESEETLKITILGDE